MCKKSSVEILYAHDWRKYKKNNRQNKIQLKETDNAWVWYLMAPSVSFNTVDCVVTWHEIFLYLDLAHEESGQHDDDDYEADDRHGDQHVQVSCLLILPGGPSVREYTGINIVSVKLS